MHFQYKFSNLLGTVYRKGDLVYSKDGNSIFVPVGNKITCYDLRNSRSHTLPIEVKGNFTSLALSPSGLVLLGSTDIGGLFMININKRRLLYSNNYKRPLKAIAFSPDGKYFATASGSAVNVYRCAGMERRVFNPFQSEKVCKAATAEVTCLCWSDDSRLIAFGSKDMLIRVFPVKRMDLGKQLSEIGGHASAIVSRFGKLVFSTCSLSKKDLVESSGKDEEIYKNKVKRMFNERNEASADDEMETQEESLFLNYTCDGREMLSSLLRNGDPSHANATLTSSSSATSPTADSPHARLLATASCFHQLSGVLTVACSTGDFAVVDLSEGKFSLLHSLNISHQSITSVAINAPGDWLALGVSSVGQLFVWELRSETFILRQQGHHKSMSVVACSPDGSSIASGGEDGKVKLWSSISSYCYVTFSEHTDAITGLAFTQSGRAVLSSSLDGTVRAFDLLRYRNFKTMTSPRATQFTCLSLDSSGELVAAGGQDCHQIYLWSLKIGSLLEVLSGHAGPVSSLCFSPLTGSSLLVSTAWDKTVKIWESINSSQARESIDLHAHGACVCIRPDGKQLCVSSMDGQLTFFNTSTAAEEACIEGRRDMGLSRGAGDGNVARKILETKFFESLAYSSDGLQLLAGGLSKFVCVYSIAERILVKRFSITENRTLDGVMDVFTKKSLAQNGINTDLVEQRQLEDSDRGIKVPGCRKGDMSLRAFRPEIKVSSIAFAPTGRNFVVCCTEGLLVYSQDSDWLFDPLALDISNTPSEVKRKLLQQEWGLALMMAIRLNIDSVKQQVLETIPIDSVPVLLSNLPLLYVEGLLQFLAEELEQTRHVGVYAYWARQALYVHGVALKSRAAQLVTTITALHGSLHQHHQTLSKLCASNEYSMRYLQGLIALNKVKVASTAMEVAMPEDSKGSERSASDSEDALSDTCDLESDLDADSTVNI